MADEAKSFYENVTNPKYESTFRTYDEPSHHTGKDTSPDYYAESGGYSGAASVGIDDFDSYYGGGDYYGASASGEFYDPNAYADADYASPSYWYNEKAKFEADPYIDKSNPGYQNPDGFDKEFVDMILTDIYNKNSGTDYNIFEAPNYKNGDPTWQMIKSVYDQNHAEASGTEGQTGAAFQEQPPLQDMTAQAPGAPAATPAAPAPLTEQMPVQSSAAPATTPAAPTTASTTIPTTGTPVSTTAPVIAQSVEPAAELMATPVYQQAMQTYTGMGMEETQAQTMALQAAAEAKQVEEKQTGILKDVNWSGIGRMAVTGAQNLVKGIVKNVVDMEADLLGIGLTKGARDTGDTSGVTFNRQHYFDLMDQGYQYYQQQTAEGKQPAMSRDEFAEKYAEYQFRVETNDRYNPNVELEGFAQYMPEGTADISGNARLEHSDQYEGNPVNAERETNAQEQALKDAIKDYVYMDNTGDLSKNLDSIMNSTDTEQERPLTQNEMDQIILQLLETNPTEDMQMLTDFSKSGNMDQLDTWMKQVLYYAIPGTQQIEGKGGLGEGAERWTQPVITSFMSAGLTANIGEIAGRVIGGPIGARAGKAIGFVLGLGTAYLEQTGVVDLPYYNEIMEFFDKGADIVEGQIGRYSLAFEDAFGYEPFQDAGDYYRDLKTAIDYRDMLKSSWKQNEQTYSKEVWDIIAPFAAELGVNFGGSRETNAILNAALGMDTAIRGGNPEDVMLKDANEVYRFNLGQGNKITLDSTPNERYRALLNTAQLLYDMGMSTAGIEEWANRTVTELMGSNAFVQEMMYNEATDPLNLIEGNQANIMYAMGAINGDTNMMTAARANGALDPSAMAMTFLPSGMDTIVTQIAKFMGDEVHHAGGFSEVMDTYDMENQYGNRANTTRVGEYLSGINKEGKIKEWLPQVHGGNNAFEKAKNAFNNFFLNTTDDTRVLKMTEAGSTYINMGIRNAGGDPVKIAAFLDQLQNPDLITPGHPLYGISQSAVFNTFKEEVARSVDQVRPKIDKVLENWATYEENRKALTTLSEMLNVKPDKIIDEAENNRYSLADRIDRMAQKDPSILQGENNANALIDKISPFVESDKNKIRAPWNANELNYQISNMIGDGMQKVLLDKYNIQNKKTIYRAADAVKAAQNFVFLGISGTYLMNNILNNVVTRGLSNVGGFAPQKRIDNYFDRMGIQSERFSDSLAQEIGQKSAGEKTQYTRMQEAISNKREEITDGSQFKKKLKEIKKGANELNQALGIFGNLSGKVEAAESKQAIYSGTKQYMDRIWKEGIGFTRMPEALEAALDAQAPGMKESIYTAIRHGINMDEINKAILGDYIQPGLKESFLQAAGKRYGNQAEDIVVQMFDKTGFLDELKENLDGKDEAGRQKVFEDFSRTLETENARQVAQHLVDVAESVKNDVKLQGFVGALEHASAMVDVDLETRLGAMNQWDKEFTLRLREPFTVKQWEQRVNDLQQKISAQYQQLYAEKKQIWDGILQGLGMDDQYKTEYITQLGKMQDLWETYYKGDANTKGQEQRFVDYKARSAHVEGENFEGWQLRAKTAWNEYLDHMEELYNTSAEAELKAMEAMDKAFSDGIKAVTGRGDELGFVDEMQARVRDLRRLEIELNKKIRAEERTLETYDERDALWERNEAERKGYRNDIARVQKEMYEKLQPFERNARKMAQDPNNIDYDAIVRADIAHEEAQKMRTAADKYADRAWEKIENNKQPRAEFYALNDVPTIVEAEDLFSKIDKRLSGTEGYSADDMLALVYTTAGLSDEQVSQDALKQMTTLLTDEELNELMIMSVNYSSPFIAALAVVDDIGQIADDIANRVYPKLQFTNESNEERKQINTEQKRKRDLLYNDISVLTQQLVEFGQAEDPELFHRVNNQVTAQDWQTMNSVASKYNAVLHELNTPSQPEPGRFHTEQLQPKPYGNYTIIGQVMDGDQVIALVPDKMPITEINYSDDVKFQVLGIDPNDPEGIVYMAGDEPRTATPKAHIPDPNEIGSNAWSPEMDVNSTPTLDPGAMANQEVLYRDILPLMDKVKDRYESDLLNAQTQKLGNVDEFTRGLVRSYLENVVASDLSNTKYKAMRYGEMLRDVALLNYSDRYGFDNFLTMIAPYQFWMTRSVNQWIKRMGSHPRLYSHYQRVKEIEEKNEKDYLPSRLVGKMGFPMPGWLSYLGGRTFINPSQLLPLNTFLEALENIDDNKHVAEKKTVTLLEEQLNANEITWEQYQEAINTKQGSVWEAAYSEASMGEDLDPNVATLWNTYFSPNMPYTWLKAYYAGTGNKLSHLPITNVGNATAQLISRMAPENQGFQKAAEITRDVFSAPERALRNIFGFEYKEFGAYADSLIERRLRAMLTDNDISYDDWHAAILERDGNPAYDKAVEDVRQELSLKVPGYGFASGLTDATKALIQKLFKNDDEPIGDKWLNVLAQIPLSAFGQYTFAQGEETERRAYDEQQEAYRQRESGENPNAVNEFYEKYPARSTYKITNKPTQELKERYALADIITNAYYDMDATERKNFTDQIPHFYDAIINPETKAIETIPMEDLAAYAKVLNGSLPYATMPALKDKVVPDLKYIPLEDSVHTELNEYYAYKDEHFPGINTAQSYYYSLEDKKSQDEFKRGFPLFAQYQKWDKAWKDEHKDAAAWLKFNSESYTNNKYVGPVYDNLPANVRSLLYDEKTKDEIFDYWIEQAMQAADVSADDHDVTRKELMEYGYTLLGR